MSNEISLRRKVTIYNTSAQNNKVLESAATSWGQLQQELELAGIPYVGMRAVIGETQTELITNQSSLDPGDMTLFLMPRKVKSGISISDIVDPNNGVSFSDESWEEEDPEDYTFKSLYDAAMAFLTRSVNLANQSTEYGEKAHNLFTMMNRAETSERSDGGMVAFDEEEEEYEEEDGAIYASEDDYQPVEQSKRGPYPTDNDWGFELSQPIDPEVERLKRQAAELQRNMQ